MKKWKDTNETSQPQSKQQNTPKRPEQKHLLGDLYLFLILLISNKQGVQIHSCSILLGRGAQEWVNKFGKYHSPCAPWFWQSVPHQPSTWTVTEAYHYASGQFASLNSDDSSGAVVASLNFARNTILRCRSKCVPHSRWCWLLWFCYFPNTRFDTAAWKYQTQGIDVGSNMGGSPTTNHNLSECQPPPQKQARKKRYCADVAWAVP